MTNSKIKSDGLKLVSLNVKNNAQKKFQAKWLLYIWF